jgi:DNA-binding transcriptional LysR family regulator
VNKKMDINDIYVFAKVVEHGSFVGASKSLGMPRSTVSRRVSELEKRLGARLLQRTTRRLHLTDVGETYYQYAATIMSQVDEANLAVTHLQAIPRGTLRVTVPMSFGQLGTIVASYLERYPEVELELVCTDRVIDLVQDRFDVAIRAGRLADSALIARKLGTVSNILVASPAFLKRNRVPKSPNDLEGLDCLVFAAGSQYGKWTLCDAKKTMEVEVRSRLRANDMDYLRQAALAGLGIAMIPTHVCTDEIRDGTLRRVLPDWCSPETLVHALYPSARLLSPKLKVFLDHFRESLRATS